MKTKKASFPTKSAGGVHPSAEVEEGAEIGLGTFIWRHVHVMSGARIGECCMLGQGCFVAGKVVMGFGCRIQNNVSLYDGVILDEDVFVGPSAVFTNVRRPRAGYPKKSNYEITSVGRGATIGANATIVCGITIGEYAFIGAGAVVTTDVPAHALVLGAPARVTGFICACGETSTQGPATADGPVCTACNIGPARASGTDPR